MGTTAPITDITKLPLVLVLDEMTRVLRRGRSTIKREIALGTMRPMPFAKYPYRWRRADVEAELERLGTPAGSVALAARQRRRRR